MKAGRILILLLGITLIFSMLCSTAAAEIDYANSSFDVVLSPDKPNNASIGDQISVRVNLNETKLNADYIMYNSSIEIKYDPEYLEAVAVDGLNTSGFDSDIRKTKVVLAYFDSTGNGIVRKSGLNVAAIRFKALKSGTTSLSLEEVIVTNKDASPRQTGFLKPVNIVIGSTGSNSGGDGGGTAGTINPAPTPTPGSSITKADNATTISVGVKAHDTTAGMVAAELEAGAINDLTDKAKEAEASGQKAIIEIKVETAANTKTMVLNIPRNDFNKLAEGTNADVKINTSFGTVTFNAKAVELINSSKNSGNISIGINRVEASALTKEIQAKVGDRPILEFSVKAGTTEISNFDTGNVTISIPYIPKPDEKKNSIVVYYIDNTGTLKTVRGEYDDATGTVNFKTSHFSKYAVGYNEVNFKDVKASDWYDEATGFLSARSIINGVGGGRFAPSGNVTRADFLIMVMNSYDIELDAAITDNFADAGNKYYTKYLGTAKRLNLISGMGENRFAPETAISRQDMFVVLYRALNKLGELPKGANGKSLDSFKDAGSISAYAKDAMKLFIETGVISGNGIILDPKTTSTRAQAAQVLYNILAR